MPQTRRSERPAEIISEHIVLPGRGVQLALDRVQAADAVGSVLLVHGYTGSKEDFSPVLPLFAEAGYSAYAYDQRGQYESKAAGPFSLDAWAEDANALSEVLPGHRKGTAIHLVGHSFGGLVVARSVIRHRELWSSVTLLCSGPGSHGEPLGLRLMISALEQFDLAEVHRRKRAIELDGGATLNEPAVETFLEHRFTSGNPAALSKMSEILIETPDQIAALAATGVAVHVVYGERDAAWPQEVQDDMARRLGTIPVVIPDADHSPAIEQPQTTVDVLTSLFQGGH
ncbi:MAG: alpha/beta hydrolase [Propionibacteriaceae bacterium]|nr:alpha/beta hydrolase [Propionibacteriaceae bacterium]